LDWLVPILSPPFPTTDRLVNVPSLQQQQQQQLDTGAAQLNMGTGLSGRCRRLSNLKSSGGGIAGTIPTELGMLAAVTSLMLHDNPLVVSGTIPAEMGQVDAVAAASNFQHMGLFGTLPTEHDSMTKLEQARMSRNLLAGTIPTAELGSCAAMQLLELDRNSPTGTLPTELARMAQLSPTTPGLAPFLRILER
jgi:hypothetical protein